MNTLKDYYKRFRKNGTPAIRALELAKENLAVKRKIYEIPSKRYIYYNPPAPDGLAWVENVSMGLRFTGFCDKIATRIGHTGWFIDDFQDEKYQGAVYQLPARNGKEQYVVGYADPWNDDCARLDFRNRYDDPIQAAYAADKVAEKEAEEAREYNEAYSAGSRFNDLRSDLRTLRINTIELLKAIKSERSRMAPKVICDALMSQIKSKLHEYSKIKKERAKIWDEYEHLRLPRNSWRKQLWDAFCDGAGEQFT